MHNCGESGSGGPEPSLGALLVFLPRCEFAFAFRRKEQGHTRRSHEISSLVFLSTSQRRDWERTRRFATSVTPITAGSISGAAAAATAAAAAPENPPPHF